MKHTEFNQIINDINDQINSCKDALSKYTDKNCDIAKMSVDEINTTILSCRKCQSRMDMFVSKDIYHIIGMGNMNAVQMSKFIKSTKTLMTYRSKIKYFAPMNTIKMSAKSSKSKYALHSGVVLEINI